MESQESIVLPILFITLLVAILISWISYKIGQRSSLGKLKEITTGKTYKYWGTGRVDLTEVAFLTEKGDREEKFFDLRNIKINSLDLARGTTRLYAYQEKENGPIELIATSSQKYKELFQKNN